MSGLERARTCALVLCALSTTGCASAFGGQAEPPAPAPTNVEEPAEPDLSGEPIERLPRPPRVEAPPPRVEMPEPEPEPPAPDAKATRDLPEPLPEAILPERRIVAYYGNPRSERMGILGELPPDEMLARLDQEVARWEAADPETPVVPALHMIAVMAAADPGPGGKYRVRMPDRVIENVLSWAERRDALVFLDIQPGLSTVAAELPGLIEYLKLPNVHLALDPEWSMKRGNLPGKAIGTMDASDVNHAIEVLAGLVEEYDLPPKVLVVHRFTQGMLTNAEDIKFDPRVQVVVNMDGWGPPSTKRSSYRHWVGSVPVQYTGFKLFYKNDRRGESRLMTPSEVLALSPDPVYIQYQ